MKTTVEILKEARELLAKPGAWTKGAMARDANGFVVYPHSNSAVCFCAVGAIVSSAEGAPDGADADGADADTKALQALVDVLPKKYHGLVSAANDSYKTVKPVLRLFDRAIARLEAEEKKP